jgi:hypothetical protein
MWNWELERQTVTFIAKWLHEFHADNRLEGDHFYLSFATGSVLATGVAGQAKTRYFPHG